MTSLLLKTILVVCLICSSSADCGNTGESYSTLKSLYWYVAWLSVIINQSTFLFFMSRMPNREVSHNIISNTLLMPPYFDVYSGTITVCTDTRPDHSYSTNYFIKEGRLNLFIPPLSLLIPSTNLFREGGERNLSPNLCYSQTHLWLYSHFSHLYID